MKPLEIAAIKTLEQWQWAFRSHLAEPLQAHKLETIGKRRVCTTCQQFLEKGKNLS